MCKYIVMGFLILCGLTYSQQDSTKVSVITLTDGSEIKGYIVLEDCSGIQFKTLSGVEMNLDKTQVKDIEVVKGEWQMENSELRTLTVQDYFLLPLPGH